MHWLWCDHATFGNLDVGWSINLLELILSLSCNVVIMHNAIIMQFIDWHLLTHNSVVNKVIESRSGLEVEVLVARRIASCVANLVRDDAVLHGRQLPLKTSDVTQGSGTLLAV